MIGKLLFVGAVLVATAQAYQYTIRTKLLNLEVLKNCDGVLAGIMGDGKCDINYELNGYIVQKNYGDQWPQSQTIYRLDKAECPRDSNKCILSKNLGEHRVETNDGEANLQLHLRMMDRSKFSSDKYVDTNEYHINLLKECVKSPMANIDKVYQSRDSKTIVEYQVEIDCPAMFHNSNDHRIHDASIVGSGNQDMQSVVNATIKAVSQIEGGSPGMDEFLKQLALVDSNNGKTPKHANHIWDVNQVLAYIKETNPEGVNCVRAGNLATRVQEEYLLSLGEIAEYIVTLDLESDDELPKMTPFENALLAKAAWSCVVDFVPAKTVCKSLVYNAVTGKCPKSYVGKLVSGNGVRNDEASELSNMLIMESLYNANRGTMSANGAGVNFSNDEAVQERLNKETRIIEQLQSYILRSTFALNVFNNNGAAIECLQYGFELQPDYVKFSNQYGNEHTSKFTTQLVARVEREMEEVPRKETIAQKAVQMGHCYNHEGRMLCFNFNNYEN